MAVPSPCRIFLLRHGRADMPDTEGRVWNYSDAPLTPSGRRRAAEVASALACSRLDAVITSDLTRARQTAEIIGSVREAPVFVERRLRELDIGDFEGMTLPRLREVDARFLPWLEIYFEGRHAGPEFHIPAELSWPGGESIAATQQRALPAFVEIATRWAGRTVAVCTHAYVFQALLCHVVGIDVSRYWAFAGLNASVTLVEVGPDGRGVIRALNADLPPGDLVGGRLPTRSGATAARDVAARDAASTCRVFIARHGQSMAVEDGAPVFSHHPIGLTASGRSQARRLATRLEPVRLDAVYTSDLNRARETAAPVAEVQELTPVVVPELREISLGDFEGITLARVHGEHADFIPWLEVTFNDWFPSDDFHHPADLVFPGGESVVMVYERTIESFLRIVRAHLGGTIAVIGHGWVLQPILCHVIGAPTRNYFRLQLPYAAPALVEVDGEGIGVLEVLNAGCAMLEDDDADAPPAPAVHERPVGRGAAHGRSGDNQ